MFIYFFLRFSRLSGLLPHPHPAARRTPSRPSVSWLIDSLINVNICRLSCCLAPPSCSSCSWRLLSGLPSSWCCSWLSDWGEVMSSQMSRLSRCVPHDQVHHMGLIAQLPASACHHNFLHHPDLHHGSSQRGEWILGSWGWWLLWSH